MSTKPDGQYTLKSKWITKFVPFTWKDAIKGGQLEAQATGAPGMYDGNKCKSLRGEPKLWKISLPVHLRRVRNSGHEATYHIHNDIHPQHFLVTDGTHNRAVLGNDENNVEYFIQHADGDMSQSRFWNSNLLDGSPSYGAHRNIPVYISCAFDKGTSYLACDDDNRIVRSSTPYIWFMRRGRNSMTAKDVTKQVFKSFKNVVEISSLFIRRISDRHCCLH